MSWFDTGYEESFHQDPADDPDVQDEDVDPDDLEPEELFDDDIDLPLGIYKTNF
jgi:hypothetical protein